MNSPEDLEKEARHWVDMSVGPLRNSVIMQGVVPFIKAYLRAQDKLPWHIRLAVLFTGRIPKSYLEDQKQPSGD